MPRARRSNTRQRILDEALASFCSHGYEAANLRTLAERLDITTAALYYHFDSKHDILVHVVGPLLADFDRLLGDPPAAPAKVLAATLDVLLEHRNVVMLVSRDRAVGLQPGIGDSLQEQRSRLLELLGADDRESQLVRATAAVGALVRPVVELPDVDVSSHRDEVLAAACGALGIRSRPKRSPSAA